MVDAARLKDSFARVAANGDRVTLYFYSTLFLSYPDTREMFPTSMAGQRDRLFAALGRVVSDVDNLDALVPYLRQLGRDHRMFAVLADHYPAVGEALLATLAKFLGDEWTDDLAAEWTAAYGVVSDVMMRAAADAEATSPPWWNGEVVAHQRRSLDVAVLQVRPDYALPFRPGQSVRVETRLRAKEWRYYSPANAPRPDGTIELHVAHVDGGQVSPALISQVQVGDMLRLGAPIGTGLDLDRSRGGDLLLIAGGTGLAPLKALVEQVAASGGDRRVHLVCGARRVSDLYDLSSLDRMARAYPWLTVTAAVSDEPAPAPHDGTAVDVALRLGSWTGHHVYVCGSAEMVSGTGDALARSGVPADRIHVEDYTASAPAGVPAIQTQPVR